jgi:diguanylate cyclase (GGDEF)-like protein
MAHKLSLAWSAGSDPNHGIELLMSVIDALTLEPEFERFFARAADAIRELVGADGAALILLTREGRCEYQFFHGGRTTHLGRFAGMQFDSDEGVTGVALREQRSIFVSDYPAHPNAIPEFVEAGLKANLILPLQGGRGPIGALAMSWLRAGAEAPDGRRLALAERIANQIAVACERHQLEQRLAHLASRDTLTGVANRAHILESVESRLFAEGGRARPFAVALIDLDGFKAINDERGHAFGDRVLKDVGNRIREICRRSDHVGRLGGDEFVVVSESADPGRDTIALLRRIVTALDLRLPFEQRSHRVSASIGVACYPADGTDAETLLRRADLAMYRAKRDGGNRYYLFDRSMEEDVRARQRLLDEVGPALDRGEFELYYQPVVRMGEGETSAAEALLRWRHPERGLRSAGEFINTIERHGRALVRRMGRWVLETAVSHLASWQAVVPNMSVHVNVSACYFLDRLFIRDLEHVLGGAAALRPSGLVLELTETALVADLDRAAAVMASCRALGVRLALDDFGTGYASLTYLKRLPVDTVKIDKSFVRDLHEQPNDRGIVRGIVAMANALNLSVIAEGVETGAHVSELLSLGCREMQGYGIKMPMPKEDFEDWLGMPGRRETA